jgi:hypothetical protein
MTPAAELWAAVVKHCATGRGYRMTLDEGCRLTLERGSEPAVCVEPYYAGWWVLRGSDVVAARHYADSAVWLALTYVSAPSTEPNVSC